MEVYILTLVLIFILGFVDLRLELNNYQRNWMVFVLYVVIALQIGLRWETGTDWLMYEYHFYNTDTYAGVLLNSLRGYELGYGTVVFLIKKLTNDYSIFLIIHAVVFYLGIFSAAKKYSPYFFITLMFYYATSLGMVGSNRQLLAIAICLFALQFVIERKPLKFFTTVGAAFLFHTTAVLFVVYYFFNKNFKTTYVILALIISFIIGKTDLPFFVFSKFGGIFGELATTKAAFYSDNRKVMNESAGGLGIVGLLKRLMFIAIFTYNYSFLTKKLTYYKVLYNGYVFGMVMYFLFSSSLVIIISRGSLYFNIMESLLISCQFLIFYKKWDRGVVFFTLLIISIVFLFQSIAQYPDLFDPYKGLFYNKDFSREMY